MATAANVWVDKLGSDWGATANEAGAIGANFVQSGSVVYYAFGAGTLHTASGSTAVIHVRAPMGAVLSFTPNTTGTGAGGTIDTVQVVVYDDSANGSEELTNSSSIGIVSGGENPTYGLDVGKYWVTYTASGSVPSVIRIEGR